MACMNPKLQLTALSASVLFAFASFSATAADKAFIEFTGQGQVEAVHASGTIAKNNDLDGFHFVDAWSAGKKNFQNFGGLFIDTGFRINDSLEVFGRYSWNLDTYGIPGEHLKYRDRYVGIRGDFGIARVGRIESPYKTAGLGWDPLNATAFQARLNGARSPGPLGHATFIDDAVDYQVQLQDVKLTVFYAKHDTLEFRDKKESMYAASLEYKFHPSYEVLLSYFDANDTLDGLKRNGTKVGLKYTDAAWTFSGQYELRSKGLENGNYYFLSAAYKAHQGQYSINVGQFLDDGPANQDGSFVSAGFMRQVSPVWSYHYGVRHTKYKGSLDETLVGIGVRVKLNHKLAWNG